MPRISQLESTFPAAAAASTRATESTPRARSPSRAAAASWAWIPAARPAIRAAPPVPAGQPPGTASWECIRQRDRRASSIVTGSILPTAETAGAAAPEPQRGSRSAGAGSLPYESWSTARMFPAGSLNQAIAGPQPRKTPFSSASMLG